MKSDRYIRPPLKQPTEWCMGVQLFPRWEGQLPDVPDKVTRNSLVEEGEAKGDGWVALAALVFLLLGIAALALFLR